LVHSHNTCAGGISHPARQWLTSATEPANPAPAPIAYFTDVAEKSGLTMVNVFGGTETKKYIIETSGTGVAIFDYDNDGGLTSSW